MSNSTASSLGLSDEEFMNQDPSSLFLVEDVEQDTVSENQPEDTEVTSQEDSAAQEQTDTDTDEDIESQPVEDTQLELKTSSEDGDSESFDTSNTDLLETDGDTQETSKFDYESAYKKVTEPFKANGTEMQVHNPEDVVRLMQMGANYQKKMAQLKPNLKIIKMLENNELLDEAKLHNLIDLSKKDPKAVAKLVGESGIDPLDIDAEDKLNYSPTNYSVSDKEYDLDQVLNSIKDTDTFNKTINVLTKDWDSDSKTIISDNPDIISIINTHMGNGVFDKVNEVMQQEKALGKLSGISDVTAYKQIADHLHKEGLLVRNETNVIGSSTVLKQTDNTSHANAARNKQRKAVAPVRQTSTKSSKDSDNFLNLSDEEFLKRYGDR